MNYLATRLTATYFKSCGRRRDLLLRFNGESIGLPLASSSLPDAKPAIDAF